MASPLLPDKLGEFTNLTIAHYTRGSWVDLSLDYQHYCFARLMQRPGFGKVGDAIPGGQTMDWKLQVGNTGTYQHTEMYGEDRTSNPDLTINASVPWTKTQVSLTWDIDEDGFQSSQERLVSIIKVRTHAMWNDWFEGKETDMWTAPTSSSQNPRIPFGIPFWIQKDPSTTPAGAFSGGNPSGFSDGAAGVSSATYPNWDNWTFGYTLPITRDVFVDRVVTAMYKCSFKAPHNFADLLGKGEPDWMMYTTFTVANGARKLAEDRNDNLGPDLARYAGETLIQGTMIKPVPYLDANTSDNPVYGINWNELKFVFKPGAYKKMTSALVVPGHSSSRYKVMRDWQNWRALSRRSHFAGSIA